MATQEGDNNFRGRIKGLSYYKMRGSDKTIVRSKGGASKKRIKNDPKFANTRRLNSEFAGCIAAMKHVRNAVFYVSRLADFNFSPHITAIVKKMQEADVESEWGQRNIYFSRSRGMLSGFNLNTGQPFDHVVRHPVQFSINRRKLEATVKVPQLTPDINLTLPWSSPMYRLVLELGMVTDVENVGSNSVKDTPQPLHQYIFTAWLPAAASLPQQTLKLKLDRKGAATANESLLLAVGIEMGNLDRTGEIMNVKYQGSAKYLAMA